MSNPSYHSLRIIGTLEAVAEVAMYLCQDHKVNVAKAVGSDAGAAYASFGATGARNLPGASATPDVAGWGPESFGIRMVPGATEDAPGRCELATFLPEQWRKARELSLRYPDVVVGTLYEQKLLSSWRVEGFLDGARIVELSASPELSDGGHGATPVQEYGSELDAQRNGAGLAKLHSAAAEHLTSRMAPRSNDVSELLRQHGWPRWSLLAHAANEAGAEGMRAELSGLMSVDQMLAALTAEIAAAHELGVASWVETSMFGDATAPYEPGSADADAAAGGGYAVLAPAVFRDRHCSLLKLVSQAPSDPVAMAVLEVLSSPTTKLACGLHPAAFLTASAAAANEHGTLSADAARGLEEMLSRLAASIPRFAGAQHLGVMTTDGQRVPATDPLLRSVLAIAAVGRASESQLKPALAAGVAPDFLLRTLLSAPERTGDHAQVLGRMHDAFGEFDLFPARLVEEVEASEPGLRATFEAMRTAEAMSKRIADPATRSNESKPAARRAARP